MYYLSVLFFFMFFILNNIISIENHLLLNYTGALHFFMFGPFLAILRLLHPLAELNLSLLW